MMMAVKSSGKDRCPEWPIIPEQDESPKFGYMLERKVGKKNSESCLILATGQRGT